MPETIITRHRSTIAERKDMENAIAAAEQTRAFLDYNIMMGYIEDPNEDDTEEVAEE